MCVELVHFSSLVPRPSHHPVFDRLQYAKMEGEGRLGIIYHVNDVSVYLGRQRVDRGGEGSPIKKTS